MDVIVESGVKEGGADVAFTVRRADFAEARRLASEVSYALGGVVEGEENLGKVSVVGRGCSTARLRRSYVRLARGGGHPHKDGLDLGDTGYVRVARRPGRRGGKGLAQTSSWRREMFSGTFTALVTPFRNGEVDVEALEGWSSSR